MSTTALVSILGPDRVGLVSAIAGRLFDLGANLGDTTFAVLGGGAEFTAICEFAQDMDLETLQSELEALEELAESEVNVSHFDLAQQHPVSGSVTHRITISGGDRPGLLARLCEVYQQFGANIVRLNSEHIPDGSGGQYVIRSAVSIPEESRQSCLATVANTAGELGLNCEWSVVKPGG